MSTLPRIAWSVAEFAEMTGLSTDAVYDAIHAGEIPAVKFGQQWRIANTYVQQVAAGTVEVAQRRRSA
jgi:excisionase family DNA binding protein